jgi:hypothetical protein
LFFVALVTDDFRPSTLDCKNAGALFLEKGLKKPKTQQDVESKQRVCAVFPSQVKTHKFISPSIFFSNQMIDSLVPQRTQRRLPPFFYLYFFYLAKLKMNQYFSTQSHSQERDGGEIECFEGEFQAAKETDCLLIFNGTSFRLERADGAFNHMHMMRAQDLSECSLVCLFVRFFFF